MFPHPNVVRSCFEAMNKQTPSSIVTHTEVYCLDSDTKLMHPSGSDFDYRDNFENLYLKP